ncbi:MAG: HPr(Ser) kinase/phosphatase, partial [Lachnospiraceae bacterium]|nr:HPr(Ser) kinase/phosphatase [Lachnospiraceae bacterium]
MATVAVSTLIEKMQLTNLTPEIDVQKIKITQPDINRPALQLAGYTEHFERSRVEIIGFVEYSYMESLSEEVRKERYNEVICEEAPC